MIRFRTGKEGAQILDREDVLSGFRQRFYLLPKKDIYGRKFAGITFTRCGGRFA